MNIAMPLWLFVSLIALAGAAGAFYRELWGLVRYRVTGGASNGHE